LTRLRVALPRAVWFAKVVLGGQQQQQQQQQQSVSQPQHGQQQPAPAPSTGPAQVWTGALLVLLSQLAAAVGSAAADDTDQHAAAAAAAAAGTSGGGGGLAATVATPPQPPLLPATEQQAYRGAAAAAGAPDNPAAAASWSTAESAEQAAARLVEAAGGDVSQLQQAWGYVLRLACYSLGCGMGDPPAVVEWCLIHLAGDGHLHISNRQQQQQQQQQQTLQQQRQQQYLSSSIRGGGTAVPLLREAALQLVSACIEDVASSSLAVSRLISACLDAAECVGSGGNAGGSSAPQMAAAVGGVCGDEAVVVRLRGLATDVLRALVLLAPSALPALDGLPRLARLLLCDSQCNSSALAGLASESVACALAESRSLSSGVSPK